jgi:dihydrofolate reductase
LSLKSAGAQAAKEGPLRAMIAAVTRDGVIGVDGKIPWHYSADLIRFKRLTKGKTVIMGRRTFESLGMRPLPGREGVETFVSLEDALLACADEEVWFVGGREIYREAMAYADLIDLTYVPDVVDDPGAVRFPAIDPDTWEAGPRIRHEADERLERQVFRRRDDSGG